MGVCVVCGGGGCAKTLSPGPGKCASRDGMRAAPSTPTPGSWSGGRRGRACGRGAGRVSAAAEDPACTVHVLLWGPRNGARAATSRKSPAPDPCWPRPRRSQTPWSVEEAFCKHSVNVVNVQVGCSLKCIWNKRSPHSTSFSFFMRCEKEQVRPAQVNGRQAEGLGDVPAVTTGPAGGARENSAVRAGSLGIFKPSAILLPDSEASIVSLCASGLS